MGININIEVFNNVFSNIFKNHLYWLRSIDNQFFLSMYWTPLSESGVPCELMTLCEVLWWKLSRSVTKNLTAYRFNSGVWGLDDMKREIHSFPTMYIMGGGKWCRNGSKLRFSQKKWPKNSFFEGHKSGSTDFGGVWHPYFWRYR